MAKVKANRFFQTEAIGAKEAGDEFEYDLDKDPQQLKALGYVEAVSGKAPAPKE